MAELDISLDPGLLQDYFLFRHLAGNSQAEMARVVRQFAAWLQRPASLGDLTDRVVSEWLVWLEGRFAARSVANHRTALLCLWRFAAQHHGVRPPGCVRRASRPEPCPVAWTLDELGRILERCKELRGYFRRTGASRAGYCTTLVRFCYESGLRRSDVWRVGRDQVRADGTIVLRQHKTGQAHWPRIRNATWLGWQRLPGAVPLACPYANPTDFYHFWRDSVTGPAGVRRGALQQLRRTGATYLAIEHREAVQRYLGHRTASMQRHYVDQSIAAPQQWLPPEVGH
jgi:integrase